ncbi:hypothetical protein BKA56DRAFT_673307 [Ilyonectria sp. MPI-CAGE-AT-0026]|nr:hypothetical protein BKA56DRAFT_673307 [Ilyonectria sp. MPI-CAGE-AT-0026]
MFLNLLAVAFVDDARLSASWVVGSDRGRLGWLELQLGLKPLLMATSRLRDASALQPMFEASDDEAVVCPESRLIDPDPGNVFICLQFVGKLGPEFVELLHCQGDRALWMFGYWLGLLGRFGFWWLRRRVERDFCAIVLPLGRRLKRKGGDEAGDWDGKEATLWENLIHDIERLEEDWGAATRPVGIDFMQGLASM